MPLSWSWAQNVCCAINSSLKVAQKIPITFTSKFGFRRVLVSTADAPNIPCRKMYRVSDFALLYCTGRIQKNHIRIPWLWKPLSQTTLVQFHPIWGHTDPKFNIPYLIFTVQIHSYLSIERVAQRRSCPSFLWPQPPSGLWVWLFDFLRSLLFFLALWCFGGW